MELPLPGDRVPEMHLSEWLQRGVYDEVRPVGGRLITVLESFASWDPLSRHVLPLHDALQSQLQDRGVRFLAIAEDDPQEVQAYLRQAKLKHLAVACDDAGRTLGSYVGRYHDAPLPFAVIARGAHAPRIVWMGPVAVGRGSFLSWHLGYVPEFEQFLTAAAAGRVPVGARRRERARRRLCHMNAAGGDAGQLAERARRALSSSIAEPHQPLVANLLAMAAAALMTAEGATARRIARGQALAARAVEFDSGFNPFVPHAQARALFLAGEVERALALQREANARMQREGWSSPNFDDALREYEQAAGQREQAQGANPAAPAEPPPPPTAITAAQAKADLLALREHLRDRYVGWEDVCWALAGARSSWEERTTEFMRRIRAREQWPVTDFFDLLLDYLSVIRDRHLRLNADPRVMHGRPHRVSPTPATAVFFSGVRVHEAKGRMRLQVEGEAAHLYGAELVNVPVVPDAKRAQHGQVYLFPALPHGEGRWYLLGVLAEDRTGAESVTVTVRREGRLEPVTLPVHRGGAARQIVDWQAWEEGPAWSLEMEPHPVLEVRRMWGNGIEAMPETADQLRAQPTVVLDLRGNGGGGDDWGVQWCTRFTNQELRKSWGYCGFHPDETDPAARWITSAAGAFTARSRGKLGLLAPERYRGRLVILMDNAVGSAAECMVAMACQIDGALLIGENSQGCMTYGNADQSFDLPNGSMLRVTYPRNKDQLAGRPFREGFGFFPDYWLDTDDPVRAAAEFLAGET